MVHGPDKTRSNASRGQPAGLIGKFMVTFWYLLYFCNQILIVTRNNDKKQEVEVNRIEIKFYECAQAYLNKAKY